MCDTKYNRGNGQAPKPNTKPPKLAATSLCDQNMPKDIKSVRLSSTVNNYQQDMMWTFSLNKPFAK